VSKSIKYETGPSKIMHTESCLTDCPYEQSAPNYPKINKVGSRVCRSCPYYNKGKTIYDSNIVVCNYELLKGESENEERNN